MNIDCTLDQIEIDFRMDEKPEEKNDPYKL